VDYSLNYAPPASTKALLPLHYITFCVFLLYSTFLYLVLPPANYGCARSSPSWSCHAAAEPQPTTPRLRPVATSPATQRSSPGRPRRNYSKTVVGRAEPAAGCTKAVAGCALATPRPWLAVPPQSTH
jgi:hypothetical protein